MKDYVIGYVLKAILHEEKFWIRNFHIYGEKSVFCIATFLFHSFFIIIIFI